MRLLRPSLRFLVLSTGEAEWSHKRLPICFSAARCPMIELSGMAGWVLSGCLAVLGLSLVLSFVRLLRGPSLPDRIIALDLVAYQAVALMLTYAVVLEQPNFLEVALVLALI